MINEDSLLFLYEFRAQAGLREIPFFFFPTESMSTIIRYRRRLASPPHKMTKSNDTEAKSNPKALFYHHSQRGKSSFLGGKCAWWWGGLVCSRTPNHNAARRMWFKVFIPANPHFQPSFSPQTLASADSASLDPFDRKAAEREVDFRLGT